MIEPFHERTVVNGMTFGCGPAGYDIRIAETLTLKRNDFVLASSIERFQLPLYVLAQVCDKSSWARKGLFVQNTIAEPGWHGYLTLELSYHDDQDLRIEYGTPIAQMIFFKLITSTSLPYRGKYQGQATGPQPAIEEKAQ